MDKRCEDVDKYKELGTMTKSVVKTSDVLLLEQQRSIYIYNKEPDFTEFLQQ